MNQDEVSPDTAAAAPERLSPEERDVIHRVMSQLAGPDAQLRGDQLTAVQALGRPGARVVVVQATGWGKSAVYWVATALNRARGQGPTLVISPLLSLMRDQVSAAARAGLRAEAIHSGNLHDWSRIESAVEADAVDVLLVSPERLANPSFGERVMSSLAGRLGLLVIDEAHSVSDWGHDFRPDYRRVADVLRELSPLTPVLATTATANQRVTDDLAAQLGDSSLVLRGPLARSSLYLSVLPSMSPLERMAWVVEHLPQLPGSGIIYTLTVAEAERLALAIQDAYPEAEVQAPAYTGQLDAERRERLEDDLRANRVKALVATSALGMGYDKPDVGFVIHLGAPASPVSYYQHVGRAGRAIDRAVVALLPSPGDERIWEHFATATIPDKHQVETLLAALSAYDEPVSSVALEAELGFGRTRTELLLKQLAVDGAVVRSAGGWSRGASSWQFDAEHYAGVVAVREREADIMRHYLSGSECLMALLRRALDDPDASPCGQCSVCVGSLPKPLKSEVPPASVERIGNRLRSKPGLVEPRKMWPGGEFGSRGKIRPESLAEVGRVLIHADAPEWLSDLHADLDSGGEKPASAELMAAGVDALREWSKSWARRPTCVLALPTRVGAQGPLTARVMGLAQHLGQVGQLPAALWDGVPPNTDGSSNPQAAARWRDAFAMYPFPDVEDQVVLLVVDHTRATWEQTVAASVLRSAGASACLPLVIHHDLSGLSNISALSRQTMSSI